MAGYVFALGSTYSFAVLSDGGLGARCGCCSRDTSAPYALLSRSISGPDGEDLIGPELSRYMAEAIEVRCEGSRTATDGIVGFSPLRTADRGYALWENCEAVLLERDIRDGLQEGESR